MKTRIILVEEALYASIKKMVSSYNKVSLLELNKAVQQFESKKLGRENKQDL